MKTDDRYKLNLQNLPDEGERLSFDLDDEFFASIEGGEIKGGDVEVEVFVQSVGQGTYEMEIDMSGDLTIQCDRCLCDMSQPIESNEVVRVKTAEVEEQSEDDDGELITIPVDALSVDLARHFYETAALNIPLRHVHEDGECDEEMSKRLEEMRAVNADDRTNESGDTDPRWNELKKLIDNNK